MYLIDISEEQRKALIEVLKAADPKYTNEPVQGLDHQPPLKYWITMLEELPKYEDGQTFEGKRGMIYGFCL